MITRWALPCLLLACLTGSPCAGQGNDEGLKLAVEARRFLDRYCRSCHSGPGSEGGDLDVFNHAELLAKRGDDKPYIIPKKPEESYLWERIARRQMPPPRSERPSEAEKASFKKWIEVGAPNFPTPKPADRPFLSLQAVLSSIHAFLSNKDLPGESRPFLRFFTLHNLYNNTRAVPDEDLRLYRAALSKAINSLSRKARIVLPLAIDKTETIFVIDTRDLDWDKNDLWREVMRAYPYGLHYRNHPNEQLRRLDEEIGDLTNCDMAYIRADWFISTAMRPPLYHTLMRLPKNARELEKEQGIDIADNFLSDKLVRAGFSKSGVSSQNRMVERHEGNNGAYWKSYDFKPDAGLGKLTRFPLGPLDLFGAGGAKHPFAKQAFRHDGGEIIFRLPNGLHGYLLVDGNDVRIDAGPVEVVSDSKKTSGTPIIVNGISCMGCHRHGLVPLDDTIRDSNAVLGEAERKVRRLYPGSKKIRELIDADRAQYLEALEKVIGKFLKVGIDATKPLTEFDEPISRLVRPERQGYLDLQTVAYELDVEKAEELARRIGEKKFKLLGLEALLRPGGVITRAEWEAVNSVSLMQETARELRATPVGPPRRKAD